MRTSPPTGTSAIGRIALLLLAFATFGLSSLAAQDDDLRPALGPHRFMPNNITRDPFPRTYVRNTLGIGQVTDIPIVPKFEISPGDTIGGLTGNLIFAILDFEYQQRIKDWLSVWGQFNLRGRLGDDVGALLAEGVTLSTGFEIGWMFRVFRSERVTVAATAQVWNNNLTGLNIFDYLQGVIDTTDVPLVRRTPILRGGGSLRFAWAANAWFGVTATGEFSYGESADRTENNSASSKLALAGSLDLGPLIDIPIGIVLAGDNVFSPDTALEDVSDARRMQLRIAYAGRRDFLIALDLTASRTPLRGVTVTGKSATVSMRYYF